MSDNIQLLQAFAKEVATRNLDGIRELVHEDVVVHEAPSLPFGGDHHGPEAFIRLFEKVQELWEFTHGFDHEFWDAGPDTVIFRVEVDSIGRATGKRFLMRLVEVVTIRDGKIAEMDVFYWDTAQMCDSVTPET